MHIYIYIKSQRKFSQHKISFPNTETIPGHRILVFNHLVQETLCSPSLFQRKLYQGKKIKLEAALEGPGTQSFRSPQPQLGAWSQHISLDFKSVHNQTPISTVREKNKNLEEVTAECLALSNATSWYSFQSKPDVK